MPKLKSVMDDLKARSSEKTQATYARHGMPADRTFGVSTADMKVIAKTIKGDQALALELYATGKMEAMYVAGMVASGAEMSKSQLQEWAEGAEGLPMIESYTVPWVAVENAAARDLAMKWIDAKNPGLAAVGWSTYSGLVTVTTDAALALYEVEGLLAKATKEIHVAENRVRKAMNGFVIAVGMYVVPLLEKAKDTSKMIGDVSVDVGDTACKVPVAGECIAKAEKAGKTGVKRKTIRC